MARGLAVDKACEERQKVVVQLVLDCQVRREEGKERGDEEKCFRRYLILFCSPFPYYYYYYYYY